jgi:hypothetical protein
METVKKVRIEIRGTKIVLMRIGTKGTVSECLTRFDDLRAAKGFAKCLKGRPI